MAGVHRRTGADRLGALMRARIATYSRSLWLGLLAAAATSSVLVAHAAAPAQRIVSLAPNLTELVYSAGAGERMVGADAYSDFPAAAQQLPRVGDAFQVDYERVLALHPDL